MIHVVWISGWLMGVWFVTTSTAAGVTAMPPLVNAVDSGRMVSQLPVPAASDRQSTVSWPIDAKVDTVLRLINTGPPAKPSLAKAAQERFMTLFAPSGYFIVLLPNKTELWVSASQFLARLSRTKGVQYQLKAAKVIHFNDISRNPQGQYSSRATIYFDVTRFDNHVPVTQTTSRVTIPLAQTPPAMDYWQIYELKVVEVSNSLLASPPRLPRPR